MEFMKISAFADKNFKTPLKDQHKKPVNPYMMMINPDTIRLQQSFGLTTDDGPKCEGKLSFETVIDCTGIVDATRTDLPAEMSRITSILYQYKNNTYKPNYVPIQWGNNLNFYGVLASLDTSYTLFKPDGTPLRVKLSFVLNQYIKS